MSALELRLLGACEGQLHDGRSLELPTRKTWALLSYLALHADGGLSRERLATLLWGERFDEQARRSLRQAIYELRNAADRALTNQLEATREAVTLARDGLGVDLRRFETLVARGDTEALRQADALYRGPLLDGLETGAPVYDAWLAGERARLQELACGTLERLAETDLEQGEPEAAIGTARRIIALDPLRETAHGLLMRALAALGRRGEALKHFQDLEKSLQAELGVGPGREMLRLRDTLADDREPGQAAPESPHPAVASDPGGTGALAMAIRRGGKPRARTIVAAAAILAGAIASAAIWQLTPRAPERLAEVASEADMAFPLPDKPSIAVLPFENLSDDPRQDYLVDGLTEDLITALSKVPQLFVISRSSTAGYKEKAVTVRQVAEDLGVRYVLEGSVQKTGGKLRITAQLIDAVSGYHLWSDRFDREASQIFALQDDIVRRVLVELQVKLIGGEHARVASRGTTNLDAWLLRVQAMEHIWTFSREGTVRARALLQAAHERDPGWARPLAGIAWSYWWEAKQGWTDDREAWIRKGIELAERCIDMDAQEPLGYMQLANLVQLQGDHDRAVALREKAVELAPNDFQPLWGLGSVLYRAGQEERAVEVLKRAERLSPRGPAALLWTLSRGQVLAGHYEDAIVTAERFFARWPDSVRPPIQLALAYGALGRWDEATAAVAEIRRIDPRYTISGWKVAHDDYKDRAKIEELARLLAKAGLPE